jgi:hypothetical protein
MANSWRGACKNWFLLSDVNERLQRLLNEIEATRDLDHSHRDFKAWQRRAEAAVAEKLGEGARLANQLNDLRFNADVGIWFEGMQDPSPAEHREAFLEDLETASGILTAALESGAPHKSQGSKGSLVHVEAHGGFASADAHASVAVRISTEQLRTLLATAPGLSGSERGEAIAAIPDDEEDLDLERVDRLLSIATRSKDLLKGVLGWILANADKLNF